MRCRTDTCTDVDFRILQEASMASAPENLRYFSTNRILSALPRAQYPHLFARLERVHLDQGKVLYDLGDPIFSAFFIINGIVSLLATTEGFTTQIGVVGNEAVAGVTAILGVKSSPHRIEVQIPGTAMRIRTGVLINEFNRAGPLRDMLHRCVQSLMFQTSQSIVCNRF